MSLHLLFQGLPFKSRTCWFCQGSVNQCKCFKVPCEMLVDIFSYKGYKGHLSFCRKQNYLSFVRKYSTGVWLHQLVVKDATTWPWSWFSLKNLLIMVLLRLSSHRRLTNNPSQKAVQQRLNRISCYTLCTD